MKTFPKGIFFKKPRPNAPIFVKGTLEIKVSEFIQFLNENKNANDYVVLDVLLSQKNETYLALNEWNAQVKTNLNPSEVEGIKTARDSELKQQGREIQEEINPEDIPF